MFWLNPSNGYKQRVYAFKGGSDAVTPYAGLIHIGGTLYGTTFGGGSTTCTTYAGTGCGTVFSINSVTGAEAILHAFTKSGDGALPTSNLLDAGGTLYGTTFYTVGGGNGTVFKINPITGAESVLYGFQGTDGEPYAGLVALNGLLYGAAAGMVFSVNPKTGVEETVSLLAGAGPAPEATPINFGGTLYGTDAGGGSNSGTVYAVDPKTGVTTVLHSFTGGSDGQLPLSSLLNVGGTLYGTTSTAGAGGCGTVFSIEP